MSELIKMPPNQLAIIANEHHNHVVKHLEKTLFHAMEAGDVLAVAKAQLPHGKYQEWVRTNCHFSERAARNYLRLAKNLDAIEGATKRHGMPFSSIGEAIDFLKSLKRIESGRQATEAEIDAFENIERSVEAIPFPQKGEHAFGYNEKSGWIIKIVPKVSDVEDGIFGYFFTAATNKKENGWGGFGTVQPVSETFIAWQSRVDDWGLEDDSCLWSTIPGEGATTCLDPGTAIEDIWRLGDPWLVELFERDEAKQHAVA